MRRVIAIGVCAALVGLVGCGRGSGGGGGESVPETPPPETSPQVSPTRVFRPMFLFGYRMHWAGTGFFVKAPSGRLVALTAYHVLEKSEWPQVSETKFEPMRGSQEQWVPVGKKPAYLGRGFDELPPHEGGSFPVFDTSEDFALWALDATPGQKESLALELAPTEPKANEWVWAAGVETGKSYALYRAKVTKVKNGTMLMQQHDRFAPRGFSGGPVFSADGKVVGNLLAADPATGQMAGATAETIRKRINGY